MLVIRQACPHVRSLFCPEDKLFGDKVSVGYTALGLGKAMSTSSGSLMWVKALFQTYSVIVSAFDMPCITACLRPSAAEAVPICVYVLSRDLSIVLVAPACHVC